MRIFTKVLNNNANRTRRRRAPQQRTRRCCRCCLLTRRRRQQQQHRQRLRRQQRLSLRRNLCRRLSNAPTTTTMVCFVIVSWKMYEFNLAFCFVVKTVTLTMSMIATARAPNNVALSKRDDCANAGKIHKIIFVFFLLFLSVFFLLYCHESQSVCFNAFTILPLQRCNALCVAATADTSRAAAASVHACIRTVLAVESDWRSNTVHNATGTLR